jgi:hypothetical protein
MNGDVQIQPQTSISKQPGLTVYTQHMRGDYGTLKDYIEKTKVGLPVQASDSRFKGSFECQGNVISAHLQREEGNIGTLILSSAEKDGTETWLLEWIENQKDIRTWKPADGSTVELKKLHFWETLSSSNPKAYEEYIYSTETSEKLTGATLDLAKMIFEDGIESYLAYAPMITKVSQLTTMESFSSNVGKIEIPAASGECVGKFDVSKLTTVASKWLKTVDRIQIALDGTIQRTESWLGADIWNPKIYTSVPGSSSSN